MTTLLIVDDDAQNRYLIRSLLVAHGYEVVEASNGSEALTIARQALPQMIVSDILMPVMDGYTFCRECKRDERLAMIPFVFHTATYTDPLDEDLALRAGAARFITKPIDPMDLLTALQCVLNEHSESTASASSAPLGEETSYFRLYNDVLVRKLEQKMLQLEAANRALRTSEAALKWSQQIAHVGHWSWDTRANRVTWSDEMCRIFGVDPEALHGDLDEIIRRSIHPDDIERVFAMNAAVVEEGRPAPTEYRVVWPDGSIHDVWALPGAQVTDEQGNVVQLSGIVQEITERKRAEESMRVQTAALQAAANGVVITDVNGAILWANPAFSTLTGYSAAESLGHNPRELVRSGHHEDAFYHEMWNTILDGRVWRGELINRRKDGTLYTEEQTITPVVDDRGKITHFIGIKQDVSLRKSIEHDRERLLVRVQAQAEQMLQIMRSVPEGVLLLDPQGCVMMANPQACDMLQSLAGVAEGDTLSRLGDRDLATLLAPPSPGQWHRLHDNSRSYEAIARPLESGPIPTGWVLVMREITQELVVEQQLQRQERLAAVGQLAAGIAHDFNNIMSIIVMYAQITAGARELPERDRGRLAIIEQQAMRASKMIRQILDFSRQSVIERQPLDLLPLLKEEVKLLERTLPENITIELVFEPGEFIVRADPTRMQQVLMNLAFNARDAMPEGGLLHFELSVTQIADDAHLPVPSMLPGTWVRLEVTDTGTGISAAAMEHVFEPFFTTKEPGKGTGLGLAQVHGIVGQHDGHITVESQVGAGATFTIYLPLLALVTAENRAVLTLPDLPRGHGQTILVVEDDTALRMTLTELLATWGYRVVDAADGNAAFTLVTETQTTVDLILSDIVMPQMGGIGLFRALRRLGFRTPMLMITGHQTGEELEALRTQGLLGVIPKPPSAEQLARIIAAALEK